MLKISAFYFMWNPEICQDPPTCGQDDLVLFWWNVQFVYLINYFQAGADVNVSDQDGDTPLTLAIENNYETVVKLLLENGANLIK